jgi:hypothetical protein
MGLNNDDDAPNNILISQESGEWIGRSPFESYSAPNIPGVTIFHFTFRFKNLDPPFRFEGMQSVLGAPNWAMP